MRVMAFFRYSLLRLLLLTAVGLLGYLMGLRGFLLLVVAFILSGIVSYFVLRGPREAMSASIAARVDASKQRRDDSPPSPSDGPPPSEV